MQRVVHMKKDRWEVRIDRASKWGNPFIVGVHGTRGECIEPYKEWLLRGDGRHLLPQLGELEGKTLACWCAPKGGVTEHDPLVCHGQVLLRVLAWRRQKIKARTTRKAS